MDKKEAIIRISEIIETVADSDPFKGRSGLLKTLDKLRDFIVLYKHTTNTYEIIFDESEKLLKSFQKELDNGKEDTGP